MRRTIFAVMIAALLMFISVGCTTGSTDSVGDTVNNNDTTGTDDSLAQDLGNGDALDDSNNPPSDQLDDLSGSEDQLTPDQNETVTAGEFGAPCTYNTDCVSEFCVPAPPGSQYDSVCTKKCIKDCPSDWFCKAGPGVGREIVYICVPEINKLCQACLKDADCNTVNDLCLKTDNDGGKKFCARDCSADPDNPNICPDGFACTPLRDSQNKIYSYQCTPKTGSCDCDSTVDLTSDPDNCKVCLNKCQFDNAVAKCQDSECDIDKCDDGWVDLDKEKVNGCEYQCTKTSDTDEPDKDGIDANCDGIDGMRLNAVYVDGEGGSDLTGDGTQEFPFKTIKKGIDTADLADPKLPVYVMQGNYDEVVTLKPGVSIYGGYSRSDNWRKRSRDNYVTKIISDKTVETHAVIALIANNIKVTTEVAGFHIESASNPNPGGSSYAVWIKNSNDKLTIRNNVIKGGKGNNGEKGGDGRTINHTLLTEEITYTTGGKPGENSTTNETCWLGTGGESGGQGGNLGARVCEWQDVDKNGKITSYRAVVKGGKGGKGGDDNSGGGTGKDGDDSHMTLYTKNTNNQWTIHTSNVPGFSAGGTGGTFNGKNNGGNGADDVQDGQTGKVGTNGLGGDGIGNVQSPGYWVGSKGGNGIAGLPGHGGGGGGGGGGQNSTWTVNDRGGGGGGGGSGGCGGTGAKGGTAGGGSFGVFLVDSSAKIINNKISTVGGGKGGNGGVGGEPQSGSNGGQCTSSPKTCNGDCDAGNGRSGGKGGKGGHGGNGAGGGGGVSYGIYHSTLTGTSNPTCNGNEFVSIGPGGVGGEGGDKFGTKGGKGTNGKSGSVNNVTTLCTNK